MADRRGLGASRPNGSELTLLHDGVLHGTPFFYVEEEDCSGDAGAADAADSRTFS